MSAQYFEKKNMRLFQKHVLKLKQNILYIRTCKILDGYKFSFRCQNTTNYQFESCQIKS